MNCYFNTSTDPYFNLALEETLASAVPSGGGFVMLWRNRPSVIVGRNQNTAAEIDNAYVREHGIDVVRRITGGGAVYHDLGNLNYTIAAAGRHVTAKPFEEIASPVVEVLKSFGIPAEFSGRNDILAGGRKVSGSARSVLHGVTLFHGTLLFDTDLGVLGNALRPDPEKIHSKGIKSVHSRVANLQEFLPDMERERFFSEFGLRLCRAFGATAAELPSEAVNAAAILADSKYRTRDWNYNTVLPYDFHVRHRFCGGTLEISAAIKENRIAGISFNGDFFGSMPVCGLAGMLTGIEFSPYALGKVIRRIDVGTYISGMDSDGLLELFEL